LSPPCKSSRTPLHSSVHLNLVQPLFRSFGFGTEYQLQHSIMRFSTISWLAVAGASVCTALPKDLTNFLLVTTAQENPSSANTSDMKAVSATSLYVRPSTFRHSYDSTLTTIPGPLQPARPPLTPHRSRLRLSSQLHFILWYSIYSCPSAF
jgi:hypothetical protein